MKRNILTAFAVLSALGLSAQKLNYSFGFQLNKLHIGTLKHTPEYQKTPISTGYYIVANGYNVKEKYNDNMGFKILGNVDYTISENISLRSGVRFNLLRFQQQTYITSDYVSLGISPIDGLGTISVNSGNPLGFLDSNGNLINVDGSLYNQNTSAGLNVNSSDVGKTNILYTEIPISVIFKYSRFKFETGLSASIRAYSSRYMLEYDLTEGIRSINKINDSGISSIVWLMNLGVGYSLLNGIDFTMQYSRGLNGIYTYSLGNSGIPKYNIFSLGVTYNFK